MKSILIIMSFIVSASSYAAVSTKLSAPSEPSNQNIKKAISSLNKALLGDSKTANLEKARALIVKTKKTVNYKAGVYVNGKKQFTYSDSEVEKPWDAANLCYKGDVSEAVSLINTALSLKYWHFDEEWVEKASLSRANSGTEIEILIIDGPNEEKWTESLKACK